MSFIQDPAYIISILLLLVFVAERLSTRKYFRHLGPALLVIILTAILANLGVLPSANNAPPLYGRVFEYAAPLGIFFLLLQVKFADLKFAGLPMLLMFVIGSIATICGCLITWWILDPSAHGISKAHAVTGMYASTYIGGSVNFNAVALQYRVNEDGNQFAMLNAVDNIVGTIWLMLTMFLPFVLQKIIPRPKKISAAKKDISGEEIRNNLFGGKAELEMGDGAILLCLGFATVWASAKLSALMPQIPGILILTTIALLFAQVPAIQRLKGAKLFGFLLIMLFLAVIGAYCDFSILAGSSKQVWFLLLWVSLIVIIHGIIAFTIGALIKMDWDIVAVASNAAIGGSASAPVCASSLGRADLQLPGLLAGSVGSAIGTYLGIMIAEWLK